MVVCLTAKLGEGERGGEEGGEREVQGKERNVAEREDNKMLFVLSGR